MASYNTTFIESKYTTNPLWLPFAKGENLSSSAPFHKGGLRGILRMVIKASENVNQ
jgi:hypothetical protein